MRLKISGESREPNKLFNVNSLFFTFVTRECSVNILELEVLLIK